MKVVGNRWRQKKGQAVRICRESHFLRLVNVWQNLESFCDKEQEMVNISRTEIKALRTYGYNLRGDNWMRTRSVQIKAADGVQIIKLVNTDTLAVVYLPDDLLEGNFS